MRAADGAWTALAPKSVSATNGVVLKVQPDGSVLASGANPPLTSYTVTVDTTMQGITGLRLEALPDASLPKGGPGRDGYGHFRVTGIQVDAVPATADRQDAALDSIHHAESERFRHLVRAGGSAGGKAAAGYARKGGSWAINAMRDTDRVPRHAVLATATPFGFPRARASRSGSITSTARSGRGSAASDCRRPTRRLRWKAPTSRHACAVCWNCRSPSARRRRQRSLPLAFRTITPLLKPARDALAATRKELVDLQIPSTLVMRERASFERPSFELRVRGSFAAKGERMYARTPGALHPMRDDQPVNRLGLARWLIDENNPLVARVAVNRVWEQIFGRGLVETSEDFGAQGAPPAHPELLDWLATEFVAKGWSQKALIRTIVLRRRTGSPPPSRRSSSSAIPTTGCSARGPRFRMEAEMVRDTALAVSGLSIEDVRAECLPAAAGRHLEHALQRRQMDDEHGEDRYRRSLYTFWRRTSPYPSFMTFDATSREYCTVRRVRTNTPLQALTLLNDPAAFEAAGALATRHDRTAAAPARSRAAAGVKLVLSRDAKPAELDRLVSMYEEERAHYRTRGDERVRPIWPIAAWTMVANVLLNLDEAVTKDVKPTH